MARLAWAKERRIVAGGADRDADGRTLLVANTHCTSFPPTSASPRPSCCAPRGLQTRPPSRTSRRPRRRFQRHGRRARARSSTRPGRSGGSPRPARASTTSSSAVPPSTPLRAGRTSSDARGDVLLSDHAPVEVEIDVNWAEERARFPVCERYAYLNAGTFGPLARATLDAMATSARVGGRARPRRTAYFDEMLARRERVRALLAAQIGVAARARRADRLDHAGRARSSSLGLGLGPGDEVVTTDAEHFGLTGPLARRRRRAADRPVAGARADDIFDADPQRRSRRARG